MTRLLVLGLLLHHIEGVCKPLSAARAVVVGLIDTLAGRDRAAAVERAEARQVAARERAESGRREQPRRPVIVDARSATALPGTARRTTNVADQLRDYREVGQ